MPATRKKTCDRNHDNWITRSNGRGGERRFCGTCEDEKRKARRAAVRAERPPAPSSDPTDWVDREIRDADGNIVQRLIGSEPKTLHDDCFTYEQIMAARSNDDVHLVPGINDPARPHSHGRQEFIR